jgi:predicted TIM-barrel fold metal-dependent hydrolase
MKIIDIHAHTSNHPMRDLHVTSATIETIEGFAKQYGVSLVVLLATYFPHKKSGVHNYDMLERIKGHPLFKMFGSLDVLNHLDAGIIELETLAKEEKISGIKLYPGYQGFEPSEERLWPIYKLAEKFRLPVMLHGGDMHQCDKSLQHLAHPRYIEKPARDFPEVKFVVSHLSNPYFAGLQKVMNRCPNVYTDISGQFGSGSAKDTKSYRRFIVSKIKQFLKVTNGYERVMFATDFPIQSYKDSLDLVLRLKLSDPELEQILGQNALRVLDKTFIPNQR